MLRLRIRFINNFRDIFLRIFFLISLLLNRLFKLPSEPEKVPFNLFSGQLVLGKLLINGYFNSFSKPIRTSKASKNNDLVPKKLLEGLKPETFCWLYLISGINDQESRDYTKVFVNELGVFNRKFSYKIWCLETTAFRLCSVCLNIRFLELAKAFKNKSKMLSFIHFHVLYLSLCKTFVPKGLISLRMNSGIFFASLILGETISKRDILLGRIVKDIGFLVKKNGELIIDNPGELLEIFFLVNRLIRFSSTSDLSKGKKDLKLRSFQNQIAPILRGLRLGGGQLVRANNFGGEVILWDLDKELSDARLNDFSIRKQNMGFYRINSGRLKLIFNGKSRKIETTAKSFCCPAFSFELSSGRRTIFQNNSPFNFFLGHSDRIHKVGQDYNSVKFLKKSRLIDLSQGVSKIMEVKNYKDYKNNYIEGRKKIFIDQSDIYHSRKLSIPFSGTEMRGSEVIYSENKDLNYFDYINFQFFLHPEVHVWKSEGSNYFLLQLNNNEIWNFETDENNGDLHTYNYLDPKDLQIKRAFRIVLRRSFSGKNLFVAWRFFLQSHSSRITREKIIS